MYSVSDEDPLKNLQKQLNIILDELYRSTTTDFGIVINKPEKKKKKKMKIKDRSTVTRNYQFKSEKK